MMQKRDFKFENKPVLFIQHGFMDSSDPFVINEPDRALATVAAFEGYDVWLGNHRGNRYSRQHIRLDPDKDREYWQFSWTDQARFDTPTFIRYVAYITNCVEEGHPMVYLGQSLAGVQSLVAVAENPWFFQ